MIPQDISAQDIIKAIAQIKTHGVPSKNKATKYDLIYRGKPYPPKYCISVANQFRSKTSWPVRQFNGGIEANNFLIARGFQVVNKGNGRRIGVAPIDEDDESSFPEGRAKYRRHRSLERDASLVRRAKANRLNNTGGLKCDACGFDFRARYGPRGAGFIEAHHDVPVKTLKGTKPTKLTDLSLVCSNCHRMLHRATPWMEVRQLKKLLRNL